MTVIQAGTKGSGLLTGTDVIHGVGCSSSMNQLKLGGGAEIGKSFKG
ncbi:hypothetical protein ACVRWL_01150 [Streptococcus ratti]|uniref:Uncharacterized protein n=1 Tax=Streptococcus ratti TaxID=1341 RepID=A0A7X9QFJ6_STRRT|nr:hypothetical protein [Streptococcus ratti]NMD48911.1 hypothetical protein [Streptococcus ratti]